MLESSLFTSETPFTFQKWPTADGFLGKYGIFWANVSSSTALALTNIDFLFSSADQFCVSRAKVIFFLREWPISSVKTDCRTTLNNCPSISKQFVISVVCRSTLRHLEFSQLGVGRLAPIDDWKSTGSRLVYWAILTNRLMEDRPYIDYARQMSFIVVKRRQGGRCHSSDFFVNKLKEFECPRSIKKIAAQHSVIKQRIAIF